MGVGWAKRAGIVGSALASTSSANDTSAANAATTQDAATSTSSTVDNTSFDSPYGNTIPLLYGDTTSLGQLIWNNASALNAAAADPYTNFTFAVVFGRPDPNGSFVKYNRIWANGILIYDASGTSVVQPDTSYTIRMYYGTQTQNADPALVTAYGNYAPAFRGLMYLVFANYDLSTETADGKMPQIIAEIQQTGSAKLLVRQNTAGAYAPYYYVHPDDSTQTLTYIGANGFDVFSTVDGSFQYSIPLTPLTAGGSLVFPYGVTGIHVDGTGHYWAFTGNNDIGRFSLTTNVQDINLVTGLGGGIGNWQVSGPVGSAWDCYVFVTTITQSSIYVFGVAGTKTYSLRQIGPQAYWTQLTIGYLPQYPVNLSGVTDPSTIGLTPVDPTQLVVLYATGRSPNVLYRFVISVLSTNGTTGANTLYCCRPTSAGATTNLSLTTGTTGVAAANDSLPSEPDYMFADNVNCALTLIAQNTFAQVRSPWNALPTDTYNNTATWFALDAPKPTPSNFVGSSNTMREDRANPQFAGWSDDAGDTFCMFDLVAQIGTVYQGSVGFVDSVTGQAATYAFDKNCAGDIAAGVIYNLTNDIVFFNTGSSVGSTALSSILTSMAENVGFTAAQFNAENFSGLNVQGAIIDQTTGFTQILQAFSDFFRFQVYDTPGVITTVLKQKNQNFTPDWTIGEDAIVPSQASNTDDAITGSGTARILYDRDYAEDLPSSIIMNYIDGLNQCAVGAQQASRTQYPAQTNASKQIVTLGAPVITDAATANYYAQFALYETWAQAITTTFTLPPYAVSYDPTDIIEITLDDGDLLPVQILTAELNIDFSVTITACSVLQYNTFAKPGVAVNTGANGVLQRATPAQLLLADNILVEPTDDRQDGTCPYRWTANAVALLYVVQGGSYVQQQPNEQIPAGVGIVTNTLPPKRTNQWQEPDAVNVLNMRLLKGTAPTSTDIVSFYTGVNVAFVGAPGRWEMIFFQNVTTNADGTLTLSNIARGRRGSDAFMASHQPGDTIFFPTPDFPLFRLPASQAYTTVGMLTVQAGGTIAGGTQSTLITGGPLTPFRPARIASGYGTNGVDIELAWSLRSRLYADLTTWSLGEATEEFAIVLTTPSGALLRTDTSATPAYTYTQAMQQADGFTGSVIGVSISQVSAVVGNGEALNTLLPVGETSDEQ